MTRPPVHRLVVLLVAVMFALAGIVLRLAVLQVRESGTYAELGSTWRYQGREMRLTPGTYRWYVWPITQAGRASQAIVQAKLPVS